MIKNRMSELRKQFKIVKASEEYDDEKRSTAGRKSTAGIRASQGNVRTSQEDVPKINDEDYQNYLVKVESKREFNDLGETEF